MSGEDPTPLVLLVLASVSMALVGGVVIAASWVAIRSGVGPLGGALGVIGVGYLHWAWIFAREHLWKGGR